MIILIVCCIVLKEILAVQLYNTLESQESIFYGTAVFNYGKVSNGTKHFIDRVKFNESESSHVSRSGLIVKNGTPGSFYYSWFDCY